MDKSSATLVLMCSKWAAAKCHSDLTSGFYLPDSDAVRAARMDACRDICAAYGIAVDTGLSPAYYAPTAKLHKVPVAARFLACSQAAPLSHLGSIITAALTAVCPVFTDIWRARLPDSSGP
jgi:hypothetical protein